MADDIDRADALLSAHPKVKLDLTPGSEMYYHFSRDPDAWSDFFNRYNERILFGSDSDNWDCPKKIEDCEQCFSYPFNLVRNALEGRSVFRFEDHDYGPLTPLRLRDDTLKAIYSGNFCARFGAPKEADENAMRLLCGKLLTLYEHDTLRSGAGTRWEPDRRNIEEMYDHLVCGHIDAD